LANSGKVKPARAVVTAASQGKGRAAKAKAEAGAAPQDPAPFHFSGTISGVSNSTIIIGSHNVVGGRDPDREAVRVVPLQPDQRGRLVPRYEFDRDLQREAIIAQLACDRPVVVPLVGASGQGHDALIEFCRLRAGGGRPLPRLEWPKRRHRDVKVEQLCEALAAALFGAGTGAVWTPSALLGQMRATKATRASNGERTVLVHTIVDPSNEDVSFLEDYLERIWRPTLAERLLGARPVIVFALHTERWSVLRALRAFCGFGPSAAARTMRKCLASFAASLDAGVAATRELEAMKYAELVTHYKSATGVLYQDALEMADRLMKTTDGDYDAVLSHIYPLEGL
jgi:hypothetical protein